jgi:phage head maturation protease
MSGLSIGFIARDWSPRVVRGRELREIELREISLVTSPMLPEARFAAAAAGADWSGKVLPRNVRTG